MVGLVGVADDIMARGTFDEDVAAPTITMGIGVPAAPVSRRDQGEGAAGGVDPAFLRQFRLRMATDPFDILHQAIRVLEDIMINPL